MGNRSVGRLGKFAVVAVLGAALFAASPLIVPVLSSAPAAFRGMLASAADGGGPQTGVSGERSGAAAGDVVGEDPADANTVNGAGVPARPADATAMSVDYVHDGDTLFLIPADGSAPGSSTLKVRLIGLDTPEIGDHAECYGTEATEQLRALLPEGAQVGVTPDREAFDQYGRSLFYLWTEDGRFVNYELVAGGAAKEITYAPNDAYADLFRSTEAAARQSGVGLWGAC